MDQGLDTNVATPAVRDESLLHIIVACEQRALDHLSPISFENNRSATTDESTLCAARKIQEGLVRFCSGPEETLQQAADRCLLTEVAQGSSDAFALLYDRLSGPLYALCLRMTGEAREAEDILQEAFLVIWRKAQTYDPTRTSVFSWAVHLTRCKAIDHLRCRGRRLRVIDPAPGVTDSALSPGLFEQAAATLRASDEGEPNDQAVRVRQVLGALPAEQRQAIELAFFSDLSHHEISARLEQPLGTIKARIRRGLLRLRDGLRRTC